MKQLLLFLAFLQVNFVFSQTQTGIEVLKKTNFEVLKNKKIGLVTNATGVDKNLRSTVDILFNAPNTTLKALFAPEHGVRGEYSAGDYVPFYNDESTNLPVYSLYGKTKKPSPEMLKGLDAIVYDIQDIGCRSYTYISTMGLVMEAAAEAGIEVIILDRPNPLGGLRTEGSLVEDGFVSFISQFKIPYLYGLTCGELANLLNEEGFLKKKCKLTVVKMENWQRSQTFEQTGLPWVLTSPHIPHPYSAYFYPISGLVGELQNISIGVGYTLPFQVFAVEWAKAVPLAKKMNDLQLKGVVFRPIVFKPYYTPLSGKVLQGVQVHITDYQAIESLTEIQLYFLEVLKEMYPDQNLFSANTADRLSMFDKGSGTDKLRKEFEKNFKVADIKSLWRKDNESFKKLAQKYWLYQ